MKIAAIFGIIFFSLGHLYGDIDTSILSQQEGQPLPIEVVSIPLSFDETQKWKFAYTQGTPNGDSVFEWIPVDDTIDNWSELIQIQFFASPFPGNIAPLAPEFVSRFVGFLKKQFPSVKTSIISQKDDDVLFEWILPQKEGNEPAQAEIVRVITTQKGIHRIAFTQKTSALDPAVRERWIKRLSDAKLINEKK